MTKFLFALFIIFLILFFLAQPGKNLDQKRIDSSPNFKEGKAQNYKTTPIMTGKDGKTSAILKLFSDEHKPQKPVPHIKTDLHKLDINEEVLIWFGHSSMLVQSGGKRILADPVLSEAASPVSFFNKPFKGTDIYQAADIPEIDYLIITHDHYDHLSKKTLQGIRQKVKKVITPLGVGRYLKSWGYPEDKIAELDWDESYDLGNGFKIYALPARHFSGRGIMSRYSTLWASFLLETPKHKIFFSGDSGYGEHFKDIGQRFGDIDLAFMESGQYDLRWKYIHMLPQETVQATEDIKAKYMMPVHNSKYKLSEHDWNEPLKQITKNIEGKDIILMMPLIGAKIPLWNADYKYSRWWEEDIILCR